MIFANFSVWKIENMNGHLLKYVNREDLRSWGIKEFEMRIQIEKQIQRLCLL